MNGEETGTLNKISLNVPLKDPALIEKFLEIKKELGTSNNTGTVRVMIERFHNLLFPDEEVHPGSSCARATELLTSDYFRWLSGGSNISVDQITGHLLGRWLRRYERERNLFNPLFVRTLPSEAQQVAKSITVTKHLGYPRDELLKKQITGEYPVEEILDYLQSLGVIETREVLGNVHVFAKIPFIVSNEKLAKLD